MVVLSSSDGVQRDERDLALSSVSPDRSLGRDERLRHSSEFRRVYDDGKSYPGTFLVLIVLAGSDLERRAGFVAGRRVGNAVIRNRSKRLLREAYRHHKNIVPDHGYHLVLIARKGCAATSYRNIESELLRVLALAGFNTAS